MAGEGSEGPSSTPTPSLLHFTKQILLGGKSDSHKSPNSFPESVTHTALVLVPDHSRWHFQRGEVVEHWRGSWGGHPPGCMVQSQEARQLPALLAKYHAEPSLGSMLSLLCLSIMAFLC